MTMERETMTASKAIEVLKFHWVDIPYSDLIISFNIDKKCIVLNLVKEKSLGVLNKNNVLLSIYSEVTLVEIVERLFIESIRNWGGDHARFKT